MKTSEINPMRRYYNGDERLGDGITCPGQDILDTIALFGDDVTGDEDWGITESEDLLAITDIRRSIYRGCLDKVTFIRYEVDDRGNRDGIYEDSILVASWGDTEIALHEYAAKEGFDSEHVDIK